MTEKGYIGNYGLIEMLDEVKLVAENIVIEGNYLIKHQNLIVSELKN